MAKDALNTPERLFADNEVIDLCKLIIDIHRALKSLGHFLSELEEAVPSMRENMKVDFQLWGIRTALERLLSEQDLKLTRIMEIYKAETKRLVQKTKGRTQV